MMKISRSYMRNRPRAYGGVSSMASMEMDVYLNGTEEEKEADASKIRDLAMGIF